MKDFTSKRLTTNTKTTLENLIRYAFKNISGGYLDVRLKLYIKRIFEINHLDLPQNIALNIKYPYIDNNLVEHLLNLINRNNQDNLMESFDRVEDKIK